MENLAINILHEELLEKFKECNSQCSVFNKAYELSGGLAPIIGSLVIALRNDSNINMVLSVDLNKDN